MFVFTYILCTPVIMVPITVSRLYTANVRIGSYLFIYFVMLLVGFLTWLREMTSMNRFADTMYSRARYTAILCYFSFATVSSCGAYAVIVSSWTLQFIATLIASTLFWIGFITVFNGSFNLPSRQQATALPVILVLSLMWEVRVFLIARAIDEKI